MKRLLLGFLFFLFLTVGFASAENIEISSRNLKLVIYPENGGFSLYQLSDIGKGRYQPLFDDRNAGATSWFSVKSGNRTFRLARRPGRPVETELIENGIRLIFTPTDDFQAIQTFTFENVSGRPEIAFLKIETAIENTSGKTQEFALKALFDTSLGESGGIHFSTNIREEISSETLFHPTVSGDLYLASRNEDSSFEYVFDNSLTTIPESIYLANWHRLNTLTWNPEFLEGRSFNSLYSINDSAVLLQWASRELRANKVYPIVMLLGTASSDWPYSASSLTAPRINPSLEKSSHSNPVSFLTEDQRLIQIKEILRRLEILELNPASASAEELRSLNQSLETLLYNAPR